MLIIDLEEDDLDSLKSLLDELNKVMNQEHIINKRDIDLIFISMKNYPEIYSNYVAIEDDKIVGFLSMIFYKTFLHKGGTALINEIITTKGHRNKGIAKILIEKAIQYAKNKEMDEIEVGTEVSNIKAQNFYKKAGFNEEFVLLGREFEK